MDHHTYLNIYVATKSCEEIKGSEAKVVATVYINNISRSITIIDNTQILLNISAGIFAGVDLTDLGNYLQETKELIRCNASYEEKDMINAFKVAITDYNKTRKDDIKLVVVS